MLAILRVDDLVDYCMKMSSRAQKVGDTFRNSVGRSLVTIAVSLANTHDIDSSALLPSQPFQLRVARRAAWCVHSNRRWGNGKHKESALGLSASCWHVLELLILGQKFICSRT